LVSKYTSYIAIDDSDTVASKLDNNWVIQTSYVPSQLPRDWHGRQFDNGDLIAGGIAGVLERDSKLDSLFDPGLYTNQAMKCSKTKSRGSSISFFKTFIRHSQQQRTSMTIKATDLDLERKCSSSRQVEKTGLGAPPLVTQGIQDPLQALVVTQSFNGSFSLTKEFSLAVGKSLDSMREGNFYIYFIPFNASYFYFIILN